MCCAVKMEVGSSSAPLMTVIIMDLKIAVPDRWWIIVWSITLCHVRMCVGEQQKPGERTKVLEHYVVLGREQNVLRGSAITDLLKDAPRQSSFSHILLSFSPPSFLPPSVWRRISFTDWTPLTSSTRSGNWEWCSLTTWVWPRALVCDSRGLFALSALLTETDKDLGLASCKCLCSHVV